MVGVPAISLEAARGSGILKALKVAQDAVITRPVHRLAETDDYDHPVTVADMNSDLNCLILHSLEKEPNDRYQSPSELAADLELYLLHKPIAASPPSTSKVLAKFIARHRIAIAILAIVALSIVTGLIAGVVSYVRSERSLAITVEAQRENESALELFAEAATLANTRDPRVKARFARLGDRIQSVLNLRTSVRRESNSNSR